MKSFIKTWTNIPIYEQRLIFKKVELDEKYGTLRSYKIFNGAELTLLLRLSGGAKRGRKAPMEYTQLTRTVRFQDKRNYLDLIMLQLKELNHPASHHIMDHLNQALRQGPKAINNSLENYEIEELEAIRAGAESTTFEPARLNSLTRVCWARALASIDKMITGMNYAENSIKVVTTKVLRELFGQSWALVVGDFQRPY